MIPNTYKVPTALWRKFKSEKAKKVYNSVMEMSLPNQSTTTHPDTEEISPEQWETICHNMGCYAAWSVDGKPKKIVEEKTK